MRKLLISVGEGLKRLLAKPPYYPPPIYPVTAWKELPESWWPEGYDPVTDSFPAGNPRTLLPPVKD